MNYARVLGVTTIIALHGCRQRQFPTSWYRRLTLIGTRLGGVSPSAGGPRGDPGVLCALVASHTQNPVKFPADAELVWRRQPGEVTSPVRGTAYSALHLMAFCEIQ